MDAKNSPLALLAQTCSAIGADAPNPKLLANMEKSAKAHKSEGRDKMSPGSHSSVSNSSNESQQQQQKSSFKPYESALRCVGTPEDRSVSVTNRIKTPKMLQQQQQQQIHMSHHAISNGRCDSNQSASSRTSPANSIRKQQYNDKSASPQRASSKESSSASMHSAPDGPQYGSAKLPEAAKETLSISAYPKKSHSLPVLSSAGAVSPYFGGYSSAAAGIPYPMDLMTASALMSPHHAMLKAASMNPYLNYASRLKVPTSSASDSMMTCRDPFCTGCSLSPHVMGKCPAGCTQCDHAKSSPYGQSQSAAAAAMSAAHNSVAAAYAHAQLAALAAASQLPYVCNWIAGDAAYCGKRFSTSDELLQHLRTHTASMPESLLNQAGLPPSHPLFQRTYPTPPLSPLSTARYHPYSKPSLMPPNLVPTLPPSLAGLSLPHPSLAQYFSPYSLYGSRLGTSPGMHP